VGLCPALRLWHAIGGGPPNCTILEYSLGFNPMLHELVHEAPVIRNGYMYIPDQAGLGVTVNQEFVQKYRVN
jgi:L-alanine-DL-glutamate epimerase-like enolase superfamily enzyme